MSYLLARDALNGKSGKAFATINGRNIEMFGLKKIQSDAEFQEADFSVVGCNVNQKKTKGVAFTGSATIYYGTPIFLEILQEYLKTGKSPSFTFQITNEDKGSTVGKQVVALYGVTLTKMPVAMLDDSTDYLTSEVSFSYAGLEVLTPFNQAPTQLGN